MATPLTNFDEVNIPEVGGDTDTWGPLIQGALGTFDRALAGIVSKSVTSGNVTLSSTESQNAVVVATASGLSADRTVFVPAKRRLYIVRNSLGSATPTLLVRVTGGGGQAVTVPYECTMTIYCDAVDCWASSAPVKGNGGFMAGAVGKPGVYFSSDFTVGFRALTKAIGVGLGDTTKDGLRLNRANTLANPLIAGTKNGVGYDSGFYWPDDESVACVVNGSREAWRATELALLFSRTVTTANVEGAYFTTDGNLTLERSGGSTLNLNRMASNGTVQAFKRQNVVVGTITVDLTSTNYGTSSDERLKTAIEDATDLWDVIRSLRPRKFEFKGDPGRKHIGLIAQEVARIMPDAVTGRPDGDLATDGPMTVDYSKPVPWLIWAVQQLERRIRTGGL
jgi:hypothetical protein